MNPNGTDTVIFKLFHSSNGRIVSRMSGTNMSSPALNLFLRAGTYSLRLDLNLLSDNWISKSQNGTLSAEYFLNMFHEIYLTDSLVQEVLTAYLLGLHALQFIQ